MTAGSVLRILSIEVRRGVGPAAGATAVAFSALLLAVPGTPWAGHLDGVSENLRSGMFVLAPLVAAAAVWQTQREHRRGTADLLGSVPRPGWQRHAMAGASVALPAMAGIATAWLAGAVLVLRAGGFRGGGWLPTLLVGLLAVGAYAAVGVLAGRLVSFRGAAPLAAIALFFVTGLATNAASADGAGWMWLVPAMDGADFPSDRLAGGTHLQQAVWFTALTAGALAVAAAPRRPVAWAPAAVAVLTAVPLVAGPATGRWIDDRAATAPVCTAQAPTVCVTRYDAVLLDDVAAIARPMLAKVAGVPGVPGRVEAEPTDRVEWERRPLDRIYVDANIAATHSGRLADPAEMRNRIAGGLTETGCAGTDEVRADDDPAFLASGTVSAWMLAGLGPAPEYWQPDGAVLSWLSGRSADEQRAWIGEVVRALKACDETAVRTLMRR